MKNYLKITACLAMGALSWQAEAAALPKAAKTAQESSSMPQSYPTPGSTQTSPSTSTTSEPVAPKAGDIVYDNTGEMIGPVVSVNGDVVVISTQRGKGSVAISALTMGTKGLMLNMTKADVEAAVKAAQGSSTGSTGTGTSSGSTSNGTTPG